MHFDVPRNVKFSFKLFFALFPRSIHFHPSGCVDDVKCVLDSENFTFSTDIPHLESTRSQSG